MTQRYFRSDAATYETIRRQLDSAWGHPSNVAETCIQPAQSAPRDLQGRILLSVLAEFCGYYAVASVLPELLASGAVEEIDEATYRAAVTVPL